MACDKQKIGPNQQVIHYNIVTTDHHNKKASYTILHTLLICIGVYQHFWTLDDQLFHNSNESNHVQLYRFQIKIKGAISGYLHNIVLKPKIDKGDCITFNQFTPWKTTAFSQFQKIKSFELIWLPIQIKKRKKMPHWVFFFRYSDTKSRR